MKHTLRELANRIEHVRTSSKLPAYLQSELTEIKTELRKLADDLQEKEHTKPALPSVYDGMTQAQKDQAHAIQVRQMMRDGA